MSVQNFDMKKNTMVILQWLGTILLALAVFHYSPFDFAGKAFLAIVTAAIIMWVFALIPEAITGLLIPVSFVLLGVAQPEVAFKPWTSILVWIIIAGLVLGEVMIDTGLAKRLAYKSLLLFGSSGKAILFGFLAVALILPLLVPSSAFAKMFIMGPICLAMCDALGFKPLSKPATGLMMMGSFAALSSGFQFQTGDEVMVWMCQLIGEGTKGQMTVGWLDWLKYMTLPSYFWVAFSILVAYFMLVHKSISKQASVKEVLETTYKKMGSMSRNEFKLLGIVILILLTFIFEAKLKINAAYMMVLLVSLFFLPGINLMQKERLGNINLWFVFFVTGALAIGMTAGPLGITGYIADKMLPTLVNAGPFGSMMMAFTFGVLVNFLMTPLGALAAFAVPIVDLTVKAGLNPFPVLMAYNLGLDIYLLPYEVAPILYFFGLGNMSLQEAIKAYAVRTVLSFAVVAVIFGGYWALVGLM